jgi:hypothetical protein
MHGDYKTTGYGRATRSGAALTHLYRLINTQNGPAPAEREFLNSPWRLGTE